MQVLYRINERLTEAFYGDISTGENEETVVADMMEIYEGPGHDENVGTKIVPRLFVGKSKYTEYGFGKRCSLQCKLLRHDARPPYRKRNTDAGYDIFSNEDIVLLPKRLTKVETGIAISCPVGYYFTIEGRSGLGMKEIVPFRGIIDAGYIGHLMVGLTNHSDEPYFVRKDERIAQIIVHEQIHADFEMVDDFSPEYNIRGVAGFGSSGK